MTPAIHGKQKLLRNVQRIRGRVQAIESALDRYRLAHPVPRQQTLHE